MMWWLAALAWGNAGGLVGGELATVSPEGVAVRAERVGSTVSIEVDVPCGLHVYGRKEKTGIPLAVYVGDEAVKATIPEGHEVDPGHGLPVSYWLEGLLTLQTNTTSNTGSVLIQACSEDTCYPPERVLWAVAAPKGT